MTPPTQLAATPRNQAKTPTTPNSQPNSLPPTRPGRTTTPTGQFQATITPSTLIISKFREGEEARNTHRTIPVATYTALAMIAVIYAAASWAMAAHAGTSHVVAAAGKQGPGLLFGLGGSSALGQAAQVLFMTSLFAAALSFHNATWRYAFALGRENLLPAALGRTGRNNIPKAASLAQSATAVAVIGVYAVTGQNPMTRLFFWLVIPSPRRTVVSV